MRTRMVHLGFPKIRGPYFSTCTYILVLTKIKVVCKSSTRQCTRRYVQDIGTLNVHTCNRDCGPSLLALDLETKLAR